MSQLAPRWRFGISAINLFQKSLVKKKRNPYKRVRVFANAQVAQLVEQRTENPRVGGSNPPLGTIYYACPILKAPSCMHARF